MQKNHWRDYASNCKPLVDAGRKPIPLKKYPEDLDFSKTIAGTEYVVCSHFNKDADECMVAKVSRLVHYKNK